MTKLKKSKDELDVSEDKTLHFKEYEKYYAPGVLSYDKHWRMVLNIGFYAQQAGIPEHYIYNSSLNILNKTERDYLASLPKQQSAGVYGIVYTGEPDYIDKMYAMCGVMIRNYRSSRYITVQGIISALKAGDAPQEDLVCVPNFALTEDEGGKIATWELADVIGWVLDAHSKGQQLILYADSKTGLKRYGKVLTSHIENNFERL